ncbi:hypothetical protein D3C73_1396730 [compost metagenome]
MTGQPPCRPGPVQDNRHDLIGNPDTRCCPGGNIDSTAAVQLAGIIPEVIHQSLIIAEQGSGQLPKAPSVGMPIHHLDVFISHIVAPHQTIVTAPQAVQPERLGPISSGGSA